MRVNRRLLYWGVFFAAIGGVLVAVDVRAVDTTTVAEALRFWPLAVVAIGLAIVLRRTTMSVPSGMLAAAVPGLLLGGGFALAPRIAVDCGAGGTTPAVATQQGVFTSPARISVTTGCGSIVVNTAAGSGWQFQTSDAANRTPIVDATADSLSIDAGGHDWHGFDTLHDAWSLTLPTGSIDQLSLVVNAGRGSLDLRGAQIGHLDLRTNAAETTVDLSAGTVADITGTVNLGRLSFHLPATSDVTGSMDVNAGLLEVCVPDGLGVRLHHTGTFGGIRVDGLQQTGRDWQSPGYATAAHHADLNVKVNIGSVEINPIGGCK